MRRTPVKRSQLHPLWVLWVLVHPTRGKSVKKNFKKNFFFYFCNNLVSLTWNCCPVKVSHTAHAIVQNRHIHNKKNTICKRKKNVSAISRKKKKEEDKLFFPAKGICYLLYRQNVILFTGSTVWKNDKFTLNLKIFRENISCLSNTYSQNYKIQKSVYRSSFKFGFSWVLHQFRIFSCENHHSIAPRGIS